MKFIRALLYNLWKGYILLIFSITLILFYPVLVVFINSEKLKPYSFQINVVWSICIRVLCFYAVDVEGEKPDLNCPTIITGNHTSYLDIFLLYSILPKNRFLFIGKSELLKYPLLKTYFTKLNIPVKRDNSIQAAKAFIRARRELKEGWGIVIFPEGGIFDSSSKIAPFKEGAFRLAKSEKCQLLPITFINNYKLFSDPSYFYSSARPGLVSVFLHPVISKNEIEKSEIKTIKNKTYQLINSYLPKKNA